MAVAGCIPSADAVSLARPDMLASAPGEPLSGRRIVVTRPAHQSAALASDIERLGGAVLRFPLLDIEALDSTTGLHALAERLEAFSLAIFVSGNAVRHAWPALTARKPWPVSLPCVALGPETARALRRCGASEVIAPQGRFDSEAVLALAQLDGACVAGRGVLILRGDSGRPLLADALRARGARVECVTCYHRRLAATVPDEVYDFWRRAAVDAVTLTSSEAARTLGDLLGIRPELERAPVTIFATHARIAAAASQAGFAHVVLTEPGDEGLLAALTQHFRRPE
ncbi:MAG: hypothetical protein AMXMBFR6_12150 [Betaproteobacteria bacterium]